MLDKTTFHDKASRRDPTGTSGLRRSFTAAIKLRLRMIRAQMRTAVVDHDVLGLRAGGIMAYHAPEVKLRAFEGWLEAQIGSLTENWYETYIGRAWQSGRAGYDRYHVESGVPRLCQLARQEMKGIAAVAVQQVSREAVDLVARKARPQAAYRILSRALDKAVVNRVIAFCHVLTSKAHNAAILAGIRAAGGTHVGIIPEHLPRKHRHVHDFNPNHDPEDGRFTESGGSVERGAERDDEGKKVWWHGAPSMDLRGGTTGIHVGTFKAATEALEARIGIPADGRGWRGETEYGKTLLAGTDRQKRMGIGGTGFNVGSRAAVLPREDFYPAEYFKEHPDARPTYSGGELIPLSVKPAVQPFRIIGKMKNTPAKPAADFGPAPYGVYGYFYKNEGEDAGSISATVPIVSHLQPVKIRERLQDAGPGSRSPRNVTPSAAVIRAAKKVQALLEQKVGEEVDVQTAEDDLVCDTCQEIADNGPYTLEQAEGLIPAHVRCRCAFKRAEVVQDFNPYHEPAGSSEGGQFAEGPGGDEAGVYKEFAAVNEWLRGDRSPAAGSAGENKKLIAKLDKLIGSNKLEKQITLYRGYGDVSVLDKISKQGVLKDPAFFSASADEKVAREFSQGGYIAKVEVPAGTPAYSYANDYQSEVLLARNLPFKVVGIDHVNKIVSLQLNSSTSGNDVLDIADLKQVGSQMGSNPGGVYQSALGDKFYIKKGAADSIANEKTAARLYKLAGSPTLTYRDINGTHLIATEMVKLDKNNFGQLGPDEIKRVQGEFAVHAWLANWDAIGLTGDNIGMLHGQPIELDLGGALRFRAQGQPKGAAFGKVVKEWDTLRDKSMNPQSAKVFGAMTEAQLQASASKVAAIKDADIRAAVGADKALVDILIARKNDIAKRAGIVLHDYNPYHLPGGSPEGGQFTFGPEGVEGGGSGESEPKELTQLPGGTKKEILANLLLKGTTPEEAVAATGWKSGVNLSLAAKKAGLKLSKEYKGGKTIYKGTPMSPEELAAMKQADKTKAETKKAAKQAAPITSNWSGWQEQQNEKHAASGELKLYQAALAGEKNITVATSHLTTAETMALSNKHGSVIAAFEKKQAEVKAQEFPEDNYAKSVTSGEAKLYSAALKGVVSGYSNSLTIAEIEAIANKYGTVGVGYKEQQKLAAKHSAPEELTPVSEMTPLKSGEAKIYQQALKSTSPDYSSLTPAEKDAVLFTYGTLGYAYQMAKEKVPKPEFSGQVVNVTQLANQPTAAELAAAKKTGKYYPEPQSAEGKALAMEFNQKYATTPVTEHAALVQKIAAYKELKAGLEKLEHTEQLAAQAKAKEQAKLLAEQQAKAKAEHEAKQAAEKAELAEVAKTIGVSDPTSITAFQGLCESMGMKPKDVANDFLKLEGEDNSPYLSKFEYALIQSYTGSGFGPVNKALRKGVWSPKQHVFVNTLNKALRKMPPYIGTVRRGTDLSADQQSVYIKDHIVEERAFTSTTKKPTAWSGNTQYTIESKGGRDVEKLSSHKHESEVLFPARSFFLVKDVVGAPGGHMTVHLEEVDSW